MKTNNSFCIVVIGMSGTGKTTLVGKIANSFSNVHCINLDPAVKVLPYTPFLDIRTTLPYQQVMKNYKLGPNGAILTALNLFASQPDQIVKAIEQVCSKSGEEKKLFVVDIPGQIEVFTWSSSSIILMQALSTMMPLKIVYTIDSLRCQNPNIFLSNLLFAQSIEYRFKKWSFQLLLNKSDCADSKKLRIWLEDYEEFLKALHQDASYLSTLSKTVVIHLSQFYQQMTAIEISAKTGANVELAIINSNKTN